MVFSGVLGSIDCMHWEWKNYLVAQKGQFYRGDAPHHKTYGFDMHILGFWVQTMTSKCSKESPVFNEIMKGEAYTV